MKLFQFGVWSISYKPLHETSRNKTNCGGYFIALNLTEIGFIICKHYPEMKSTIGDLLMRIFQKTIGRG